jgi:hypothetical protein
MMAAPEASMDTGDDSATLNLSGPFSLSNYSANQSARIPVGAQQTVLPGGQVRFDSKQPQQGFGGNRQGLQQFQPSSFPSQSNGQGFGGKTGLGLGQQQFGQRNVTNSVDHRLGQTVHTPTTALQLSLSSGKAGMI